MTSRPQIRPAAAAHWCRIAVLALLAAAVPARAQDSAERSFLWSEANARLAGARTPAEFLAAAGTYQSLADLGVRNGTLFYNMGVALLNAERYDDAIQAFLRAERYEGSAPDITVNMRIARAKLAKAKSVPDSWYRMPLFWHYGLPCSTRATIAAAAFSLFWLALTLRFFGLDRLGRPLAVATFAAFVLFGSSAITSIHQEATAPRPTLAVPTPAPSP